MSNSISQIASDFVKSAKNSMEILQTLEKMTISNDKSISLSMVAPDGSKSTFEIPSVGHLLAEVKRLSDNMDKMNGTGSASSIVLGDGTTTRLYEYSVSSIPQSVKIDVIPSVFKPKRLGIHDLLLDPTLMVDIDLTNDLTVTDNSVIISKLSFNSDDTTKLSIIRDNLIGVGVDRDSLINTLVNAGIAYENSQYKVDVTNMEADSSGDFALIDFVDRKVDILENGVATSITRMVYRLDTLKYKSKNGESYLKSGDILYLIPKSGVAKTDFRVIFVDINTNEIVLKALNGSEIPKKGVKIFGISPATTFKAVISVAVHPNTYSCIFVKKINPNSNIVAADWGSSIPFDVNSLIDESEVGILDYYNENVNDFRRTMLSLNQQGIKPIIEGLEPDAPILDVENFRVEKVNGHISDTNKTDEINKSLSDVQRLKSEISSMDEQIRVNSLKSKVTGSLSDRELQRIEVDRKSIEVGRKEKITQLKSTVDSILAKSDTSTQVKPKFRLRGFWEEPEAKVVDGEIIDIIGFEYRYRYLRLDESATIQSQFSIKSKDGSKERATFSNWVQKQGLLKSRIRSTDSSNKYIWESVSLIGEEININQLDVAISSSEKVEVQVRSLSELGYPGSPLKSDWSDSMIIEFPEQLNVDAGSLNKKISVEAGRAEMIEFLSSKGILSHLSDESMIDGTTFKHESKSISTPLLTAENKPKDLGAVVIDMSSRIATLEAKLNGDLPELKVSIIDSQSNVLAVVSNSDTIEIFSGYYSEQVSQLPSPKGEVVTKKYDILIENLSEIDLELLGYVPGSPDDRIPTSDSYDGYVDNIYEYFNYRRYWEAPLIFNNNTRSAELLDHHTSEDSPFRQIAGYQSAQHKSQLLNIRSRDLSLNEKLYVVPTTDSHLSIIDDGAATAYVWDLSKTPVSNVVPGNGKLSSFCVHKDHPFLQVEGYFIDNFENLFNANFVPNANTDIDSVLYPAFYHSKFFNLVPTVENGKSQLGYVGYDKVQSGNLGTFSNFPRKCGFIKEDKYLIGSDTCGSYLYCSLPNNKTLYTGTNVYNKGKVIKKGSSYSLKIPVVFQYRMTDYNGDGSGGTGIVGGYGSVRLRNLTYTKKIGVDILTGDKNLFSFDIKCTAKYRPNNLGNTETTDNG